MPDSPAPLSICRPAGWAHGTAVTRFSCRARERVSSGCAGDEVATMSVAWRSRETARSHPAWWFVGRHARSLCTSRNFILLSPLVRSSQAANG
jgi:hypothetical protein